jgi:hypothetical protein
MPLTKILSYLDYFILVDTVRGISDIKAFRTENMNLVTSKNNFVFARLKMKFRKYE